jgi:outer membrane protein
LTRAILLVCLALTVPAAAGPSPREEAGESPTPAGGPLAASLRTLARDARNQPPGTQPAATQPHPDDAPAVADPGGAPPLRLGLEAALRRALVANASVGQARAEVGVAAAQKRGALSAVLPRLQVTSGLIRNSEEAAFGLPPNERVILPLNDWNFRVLLSQPIFAGLREIRAYDQAKESVRAAEQGVRATEDRILLRVATEYISVVGGDALIEVGRQTLALAEERLRQARDFFEAGEATRVDVVRAESAVKAAERTIALARRDREAAAGRLRVDLDLDGDLDVAEPRLDLPLRPDEALLIQRAEETRADLRQVRSALRISELEVSRQKGAYLPTITADAGYVWQKTTFPSDRYGYAAVRFGVPIWTSGEIGARINVARERERQTRLAYEEAVRTVREDVRRALLNLETAETSLVLSREQLQAVEAEYEQVSDLYRNQEATSLDIQSSEATLADARRAVVVSDLARLLAEIEVYFAAGDLKSAVLKEAQP